MKITLSSSKALDEAGPPFGLKRYVCGCEDELLRWLLKACGEVAASSAL
jgi:hypothetical protein